MKVISKLFQSNEALQLKDAKASGIDLHHQHIEFLEAQDTNMIRALLLTKPDQIDLVTIKVNQDSVSR